MSIGTRSCLFCISSFNSFLNFFFDFSFLRPLGCLFLFRTKFLIIEFWLHFDLHFVVKEKSYVRLLTLISTSPIILNFFWSCMLVGQYRKVFLMKFLLFEVQREEFYFQEVVYEHFHILFEKSKILCPI